MSSNYLHSLIFSSYITPLLLSMKDEQVRFTIMHLSFFLFQLFKIRNCTLMLVKYNTLLSCKCDLHEHMFMNLYAILITVSWITEKYDSLCRNNLFCFFSFFNTTYLVLTPTLNMMSTVEAWVILSFYILNFEISYNYYASVMMINV